MERPDCRGAKGPARRIRRPLLHLSKARSGRRHPESQRTGTYYDGDRRQEAQPLASSDRRPLDRAIQPLYQRPALGPDLRSHVPVPPVLGPGLSQSTSLAGEPHARGRDRLPAVLQRFSQMREARAPPRTGARPNREDLSSCGQKWLTRFTPFLTERERQQAGCRHRLFFSQVEFCDNLIFRRRAALDKLGERLLDANRTIGQPSKITVIFGRKVTKQYRGKLQTEIEDMNLPNPVIRSHYRNGFIKQYVRDHLILRTEPATNNVTDYGVNKAIEHLPALRDKMAAVIDNYLHIQQDILETFVDRGQLRNLAQPTLTPTGKRISGLKLDNPRQLALMHALVRFAQIPAAGTFSTAEIYPRTVAALGATTQRYSLASLRYDLSKLRIKGLVEKLPRSRRYRLSPQGYSICLIFLKLFERVYAPLSAARLDPFPGDASLPPHKNTLLDRLYSRLNAALDRLLHASGLASSPQTNENKILVVAPITA